MYGYLAPVGLLLIGLSVGCASNEAESDTGNDPAVNDIRDPHADPSENEPAQQGQENDAPEWLEERVQLREGAVYATERSPFQDPDLERHARDQALSAARLAVVNKAYSVTYTAVREFLRDYARLHPESDLSEVHQRIQRPPAQTRTALTEHLDDHVAQGPQQNMSFAYARVRMPADALQRFANEEAQEVLAEFELTEEELAKLERHIDATLGE